MLALLIVLAAAAPAAGEDAPRPPVEILEWEVPWEGTRPRDPYAESARSVWFVGQVGHYLGHLVLSDGDAEGDATGRRFEKIDLPDAPGPHNVIVGEDGVVWYAGNLNGTIGRYDPDTGALERIRMPNEAVHDPHTLVFAPDGRIWFTVQHGNFVGRLDPRTRAVELVRVPTPNARPYGIVVAEDGTAWVALFGTHELASVDADSLALSEHPLPRAEARPRRLGLTSDGRVWYVDHAGGRLGVYEPAAAGDASARVREWMLPSGEDARPYGMAVDARDRIWVVETGVRPNRFVGFDAREERFLGAVPVPSGGGTVRHMHFHRPSRSIWFGTDAGTVGRAALGEER